MWELDHKEGRALKNWCFWTVVLEKTLESLLESKDIKPINTKGNELWIFIRRTDIEVEAPTLWTPGANNGLIGKDPDAGKDWRQKEKGVTEGWDGWMAAPFQWTWTCTNSRIWWGTERPGVLQSMGLQSWTQLGNWSKTNAFVKFTGD